MRTLSFSLEKIQKERMYIENEERENDLSLEFASNRQRIISEANNQIEVIQTELNSDFESKKFTVLQSFYAKTIPVNQDIKRLEEEYSYLEKGHKGETLVFDALLSTLSDDFLLLNDISIPTQNGSTTQLDHIVITPYGVIAIETKHIEGIYYPYSKSQWNWYPVKNGINRKNILTDNPQSQSLYHARELTSFLNDSRLPTVRAFVVLTHESTEYKGNYDTNCPVLKLKELAIMIEGYRSNQLLSKSVVFEIGQKLLEADKKYQKSHYAKYL